MTVPFSKHIIRHVKVEGMTFCTPQQGSMAQEKSLLETKEAEGAGYQLGLQKGYEIGKNEGIEIGYKCGLEQINTEMKSSLEHLHAVSRHFQEMQEELFIQAKPELIKLCLAICENLIGQTLSDPKTLALHIESLLTQVQGHLTDHKASILLSPEDLTMLHHHLNSIDCKYELNFVSDPSIEQGNCRIETPLGLLNFDVKRLLGRLEKKIV